MIIISFVSAYIFAGLRKARTLKFGSHSGCPGSSRWHLVIFVMFPLWFL